MRWPFYRSGSNPQPTPPATTSLASLRYVVLDTELTSLNGRDNRMLSLGAIAMTGRRIHLGEQFYQIVNPGVEIPAQGILVHQLRPDDVAAGETPADVVEAFTEFVHGSVLVGHFVEFDVKAIRKELLKRELDLPHLAIDTAHVHSWITRRRHCPEDRGHAEESVDLSSLAKKYSLEIQSPHHALADAYLTAQLWQKLQAALEDIGIGQLGALLKIARI